MGRSNFIKLLCTSIVCGVSITASCLRAETQSAGTDTDVDAELLISSLVSRNKPPVLVEKGREIVHFLPDYDWSEQARVGKAIDKLAEHAEQVLPSIIKHFDDERYCVTAQFIPPFSCNMSVGDICEEIVRDYLLVVYYPDVPKSYRSAVVGFSLKAPVDVGDEGDLKTWCQDRKNKKLFELQIEACEWGIQLIRNQDSDRVAIGEIMAHAKELMQTKKAIRIKRFGFYDDGKSLKLFIAVKGDHLN